MENTQSNGTAALQAKLNEPQTLAALTRLLDRIESLEHTVNTLATLAEQGPGMAAMMGDVADETIRQAAARGVDVEARLKTALTLAEKLTAPETAVKLEQLLTLADQAPQMAAMMGDMVDETMRRAAANGIDIEARLKTALTLADKLTAPAMVAKLEQLLALADQAPQMAAMMGDMVDETIRQAAARGVDIEARLKMSLALTERLTDPAMMANLNQLLDLLAQGPGMMAMMGDMADEMAARMDMPARLHAGLSLADKVTQPATLNQLGEMFDILLEAETGMLEPHAVRTLGVMARAMVKARQAPPERVGLMGMLRALGNPDIQRAMGFLMAMGKQLSKELNS